MPRSALVLVALTTNVAAFVVAAANGFSSLSPRRVSFRGGGRLTAALALAFLPMQLLAPGDAIIANAALVASVLLAPVIAIVLVDYWLVRRAGLVGLLPSLPALLLYSGIKADLPLLPGAVADFAAALGAFAAAFIYRVLSRRGLNAPAPAMLS